MANSRHFNNFKKIPLRPNSKLPALKNWNKPEVFNAVSDGVDMTSNYGIVTGEPSDCIVFDYDVHKLDEKDRKTFNKEWFLETHGKDILIVETPSGGFHIYHKFDDKVKSWTGTCGLAGFVDIRTTGNQVVAPGSRINGNEYKLIYQPPGEIAPVSDEIFNSYNPKIKGETTTKKSKTVDKHDMTELLEKNGFSNIRWVGDYDFDCDQRGRNSQCPLCISNHRNNHFFVCKNQYGDVLVKNHSTKCSYLCIQTEEPDTDEPTENETDYTLMKRRFERNEKACFLADNNCYAYENSEKKISMLNIKQLRERFMTLQYLSGDNKKKSFIETWVKDPKKKTYKKIDFLPNNNDPGILNTYKGYEVEKVVSDGTGDITPFIELSNHLTENDTTYLFQWLSHLMKKPEEKSFTAPVFSGLQGTGKNSFCDLLAKMIGEDLYYETNDPDNHIFSRFSTALEYRKLIMFDEMEAKSGFSHASKIKGLITNDRAIVEKKNIQSYAVKNLASIIICSNHENPVRIEESDRRFFCYNPKTKLPQTFWNNWRVWIKNSQNIRAVYDFLTSSEIDFSNVDWIADRPKSQLYMEMKYNSLPSFVKWLDYFITEDFICQETFKINPVTVDTLHDHYKNFGHTREMNKIAFARTIKDYITKKSMPGFEYQRNANKSRYFINRKEVFEWLKANDYTREKEIKKNISLITNDDEDV